MGTYTCFYSTIFIQYHGAAHRQRSHERRRIQTRLQSQQSTPTKKRRTTHRNYSSTNTHNLRPTQHPRYIIEYTSKSHSTHKRSKSYPNLSKATHLTTYSSTPSTHVLPHHSLSVVLYQSSDPPASAPSCACYIRHCCCCHRATNRTCGGTVCRGGKMSGWTSRRRWRWRWQLVEWQSSLCTECHRTRRAFHPPTCCQLSLSPAFVALSAPLALHVLTGVRYRTTVSKLGKQLRKRTTSSHTWNLQTRENERMMEMTRR